MITAILGFKIQCLDSLANVYKIWDVLRMCVNFQGGQVGYPDSV